MARRYLERAVADLSEKSRQIRRDKGLRRFRNGEIAHAAINQSGRNATFGELEDAIRVADDMRRTLSLVAFGMVLDVDGEREALSRSHRHVLDLIATTFCRDEGAATRTAGSGLGET